MSGGVTVELPAALQPYAAGRASVALHGELRTVADALHALATRHAGVVDRVTDECGELRRHVNLFVDGENVRFLDGLGTRVRDGSVLMVVAAVSGG